MVNEMEETYDLISREAKARGLGVCFQSVYLERPRINKFQEEE